MGSTYVGNFANGKFHGEGKLVNNVYIYEGDFKNGIFHGKGKATFNKDGYYDGNWENHKADG